jgi:peptidoglycan/xylan/chitin deacetylase (PgdA/CDA1 family)
MNFPRTDRKADFLAGVGKLRVLMYHSVSGDGFRNDLTVSRDQLEEHFQYLLAKGYSTILLSDLIAYTEHQRPLPPKPVLITFDDGFLNNYEIAYPLAQKYGIRINFFLVPAFMKIGEYRSTPCLCAADLQKMDPALVETGLHSYAHSNYADLIPSKIEADIDRCIHSMKSMAIPFQPCLAYPFGAYPKRKGYDQTRLFEILQEKGIKLAFRIGNRINQLPFRQHFLIQRIDVRGDEPFLLFRLSLAFGKKLFGLPGLITYACEKMDKLKTALASNSGGRYAKRKSTPGSQGAY